MTVRGRVERVARLAAGRPVLTIGIVLALALAGAVLALGLKPSAGTDTFVSSSSASYRATADDQRHFGDDAVVILIQEPLTDLVETKDLATETQLEACLAGQYAVANKTLQAFTPAPAGTHAPYGGWGSPCGKLMKTQPVQVVYGPGTFLNRAVSAVNDQIQGMLVGAQHSITTAERVWEDGKMKKSDYRKFIIKGVEGVDDFASMREVVTRRYKRVQEEKQRSEERR